MKSHSQMRPRRRAMMDKAQIVMDDPEATPAQKARAEKGQRILQQLEQNKQKRGSNSSPPASSQ